MSRESASAWLGRVESGDFPWGMLGWVPLMQGGGDPGLAAGWKERAARERDARRLDDLAAVALPFAELAGVKDVWLRELEDWNVERSEIVERWTAKAREKTLLETKREDLLVVLKARFGNRLPAFVTKAVREQNDPAVLQQWVGLAATAESLAAFRDTLASS